MTAPTAPAAHYRRLFAYDAWANREALASLQQAPAPPPHALKLLAHIAGALWLWLERLRPGATGLRLAVWPDMSPDACAATLDHLAGAWDAYLARLDDAGLTQTAAYTNTKGEAYTSRVEDVLMHVAMHGAYHRAQIAADVRAAGLTPAYTDFIHAVRQGFID
jgi:uncharacterized damage-inducible protein DinB